MEVQLLICVGLSDDLNSKQLLPSGLGTSITYMGSLQR